MKIAGTQRMERGGKEGLEREKKIIKFMIFCVAPAPPPLKKRYPPYVMHL